MNDDIDLDAMAVYVVEFDRHMRAGDDTMNARLRVIEHGCPIEVADRIEKEFDSDFDDKGE